MSVFDFALGLATEAAKRGIPLRLFGGQAVRLLCPAFPPRIAQHQDLDFVSLSSAKRLVTQFLLEQGFVEDSRFNALHGKRQMYFSMPDDETSADIVMDRLRMSHELDFTQRLNRMPYTLDVSDLLLTKLQVFELNAKDIQDMLYLLAAHEVRDGDIAGTIGLDRFSEILGNDWGWWRTVTRNLESLGQLSQEEIQDFVPGDSLYNPQKQVGMLLRLAQSTPKSLKWKMRSKVGDRLQWYVLPEEAAH